MPDESFRVERLFRPERPSRGNENVAPVQPADEAAWIWRAGCDVFASRFCDTAPTPGSLAREPAYVEEGVRLGLLDEEEVRAWRQAVS